jgi:hypothetical protein
MKSVFENNKVKELLEKLQTELKGSVITSLLKKPNDYSTEELLCVFEIMNAVKNKDASYLPKDFDFKTVRPKISRSMTKKALELAISIIEKLDGGEYSERLNELKEEFMSLVGGAKPATKKVKKHTAYQNPEQAIILMDFEANESVVFLINLINRAFSRELPVGRVNRAIAAVHIVLAIKEEGVNSVVSFAKLSLEELRKVFPASLTKELMELVYSATCTLETRVAEGEFTVVEKENNKEGFNKKEAVLELAKLKKRLETLNT